MSVLDFLHLLPVSLFALWRGLLRHSAPQYRCFWKQTSCCTESGMIDWFLYLFLAVYFVCAFLGENLKWKRLVNQQSLFKACISKHMDYAMPIFCCCVRILVKSAFFYTIDFSFPTVLTPFLPSTSLQYVWCISVGLYFLVKHTDIFVCYLFF